MEPDLCIVDLRQPRSKMKMEKGNLLGLFSPEVCLGTSIRSGLPGSGLGVTWHGHPPPSWPRPRGDTFSFFEFFFSGYLVICVIDRRTCRLISPSFIISFFVSNFGDLSSWQSKQPRYRNSPVALVPSPTQLTLLFSIPSPPGKSEK